MTEAEWLTSSDLPHLITRLRSGSARKLRLFACACAWRAWQVSRDGEGREAIELAERVADGNGTAAELARVHNATRRAWGEASFYASHPLSCWMSVTLDDPKRAALETANNAALAVAQPGTPHGRGHRAAERQAQLALLRDVFGNPFWHVVFDPVWLSLVVTGVAQQIYLERSFDSVPILADALEDAGCDNAELLNHLRGPGPHVRGCWAIDLLLAK